MMCMRFFGLVWLSLITFTPAFPQDHPHAGEKSDKIHRSAEEWRALLTPEEFEVLRNKGTEVAFTGEFNFHKENGTYTCAGCGNELFTSKAKYNSGSGWPSFFEPISASSIDIEKDESLGVTRMEILCSKCGGHLGHVFPDGPRPTGLRYCVNSISLDFKNKE